MTIEDHSALHSVWMQATHRDIAMSITDHHRWNYWVAKGWTEADLRLVIAFINRRIKAGRRFPESLRLYNLIDVDRFEQDLQDARAEARQYAARPRPRQNMLSSVGRPEPIKDNAQSAGQVIRDNEALKALLKFRDSL